MVKIKSVAPVVVAAAFATSMAVSGAGDASAETRRVCAPSGQCVTTNQYCYPDDGCGTRLYREVPRDEYCSQSVGCFTWHGKNYRYIGGPTPTPEQRLAAQKCAASLGVTWLGAIASGGVGITILGAGVGLWGCS